MELKLGIELKKAVLIMWTLLFFFFLLFDFKENVAMTTLSLEL